MVATLPQRQQTTLRTTASCEDCNRLVRHIQLSTNIIARFLLRTCFYLVCVKLSSSPFDDASSGTQRLRNCATKLSFSL
ncbi:unnamed protein product [Lasius platythorax]|uniref:Uncharacterized protein n=1 Tax=Lasius platythorax TaxID=488582 RepID=A0AAV2P8T6_9HYME